MERRGGCARSRSGATGATNVMRKAGRVVGMTTLASRCREGICGGDAGGLADWQRRDDDLDRRGGGGDHRHRTHFSSVAWLSRGQGSGDWLGRVLAVAPLPVLCSLAVFVIVVKKTRYIVAWFNHRRCGHAALGVALVCMIFPRADLDPNSDRALRHRALDHRQAHRHIRRLMDGTENKLGAAH